VVERGAGSSHLLRHHFPDLIGIEAWSRDDDEINQVQETAILFPMGQLQKSIDSDQEKKAVVLMKRTARFAHRIDRIEGFVFRCRRFQQRGNQPPVPGAGKHRHPVAMRERCQAVAVLMGRLPRRNKEDLVQPEHACRCTRRLHVSGMNWIEGSAE